MLNVKEVYGHYIPGIKFNGGKGRGICPFHEGGKPSFIVNETTGSFVCFSGRCGMSGSISWFLHKMNVPREQIADMLDGFSVPQKRGEDYVLERIAVDLLKADIPVPEAFISSFRRAPRELLDVGFKMKTLSYFEVGWDVARKRIIYPIRDFYGQLATVIFRETDEDLVDQYGKYRPMVDMIQRLYGIPKLPSHLTYLYNAHNVARRIQQLPESDHWVILVEGYKACMWVHQCGWWNVVCSQGSSTLSVTQLRSLMQFKGLLIIMYDGDAGGANGTLKVGKRLMQYKDPRNIGVVTLPHGTQPDGNTGEELEALLASYTPFTLWRLQHATRQHGNESSRKHEEVDG